MRAPRRVNQVITQLTDLPLLQGRWQRWEGQPGTSKGLRLEATTSSTHRTDQNHAIRPSCTPQKRPIVAVRAHNGGRHGRRPSRPGRRRPYPRASGGSPLRRPSTRTTSTRRRLAGPRRAIRLSGPTTGPQISRISCAPRGLVTCRIFFTMEPIYLDMIHA